MRTLLSPVFTFLACLAITTPAVLAGDPIRDRLNAIQEAHLRGRSARHDDHAGRGTDDLVARTAGGEAAGGRWLNDRTAPFAVARTGFPNVSFELPESYAGLLPIDEGGDRELFFWFVPTENEAAKDEIVIWLNGGPGCSSMYGFIKENGPFNWMVGQYEPVKNHYAWNNLSNVVWIEQPVGTGYSRGTPTAKSEDDIVVEFGKFWKNFIDLFDLKERKVYITGESYAGMYIPYIADYMLHQNDTRYFNVSGIMIYDPLIDHGMIHEDVPTLSMVESNRNSFPFNDTFNDFLQNKSAVCGFDDLMEKGLTFPPEGHFDLPIGAWPNGTVKDDCATFSDAAGAIFLLNPCFNYYEVSQLCPVPWDVLGFPSSIFYLPRGYPNPYFNRSEVKAALHAPADANWTVCVEHPVFVGGEDNSTDLSPPSGHNGGPLARVIERTNNVIVGQGSLDMVIITKGTLLSLNNLTWNGAQGFSKAPAEPFYVPAHDVPFVESLSGSGVFGSWGSDRGLTFVTTELAGHALPGFAQSAGYRQLEVLLGRIANLSDTSPFTTQPDYPQPKGPLGKGNTPLQAVLGSV